MLPLNVVREAWLSAVDEPTLHQRFLSGRVNFCTLMPMRAIPFRIICLLGMNDGDYPRSQPPQSFDLMAMPGQYRPGDRSRRQDDHYLFLEALMSAREQLYISWVGRNIRDNSVLPPSVLISQLRETLEQGWQLPGNVHALLSELTVEHHLQAFSTQYVTHQRDPRLFTYAKEWFSSAKPSDTPYPIALAENTIDLCLSLETLAQFLRAPVKTFCNQCLKLGFEDENITSEDNEPFAFDSLDSYVLSSDLLDAVKSANPENPSLFFEQQRTTMAAKGKLPLGPFAQVAFDSIKQPVEQAWLHYQAILNDWPIPKTPQAIDLNFKLVDGVSVQLTGNLNLRQQADELSNGLIHLTTQTLANDKGINYHKLLLYWVQHLAGCAIEVNVETLVVSPDGLIAIPALPKDVAYGQLTTLVNAWYLGIQEPLPVACRTAFTWLSAKPGLEQTAAQSQYEGDDYKNGEVNFDAYMARFFPDFASLSESDTRKSFEYWANTLYRPLFEQVKPSSPTIPE